jgi:hypothetical protein
MRGQAGVRLLRRSLLRTAVEVAAVRRSVAQGLRKGQGRPLALLAVVLRAGAVGDSCAGV